MIKPRILDSYNVVATHATVWSPWKAGTSQNAGDWKLFSNHSARKTLTKMKKANLERSSIAKVTGHRNIQSLDDYDEADEDEQRQISWAISERNSTAKPMPVASSTSGPSSSIVVIPHMISSQAQNLMNSFTSCTVTFNLNSKTSPVIKPRKRRLHFIESDSNTD